MKKIITLLGYAFLVTLVLLAAAYAGLWSAGKRLDKESKAFVDAAVPAIARHWNVEELKKRASNEFDGAVDYDEVEDYFASLRELGKFVSYHGATGESTITISARFGYEITADYAATVQYEEGSADIHAVLIKLEGEWQILDFSVNPGTFSEDNNIV